jgi:hypothetical protein
MLYDEQVWPLVHDSHLWVFDKLILSRRLGHLCGPACVSVPKPDFYVVRPCVNLSGMGTGAEVQWIEDTTDHLPPGYFWQEVFHGRHLSVDYHNGVQVRCTEGFKVDGSLSKFSRWVVTDDHPQIPSLIADLSLQYEKVNVEMIGEYNRGPPTRQPRLRRRCGRVCTSVERRVDRLVGSRISVRRGRSRGPRGVLEKVWLRRHFLLTCLGASSIV